MNKLKLNTDKTDAILICSPRVKNNIDMPHIDLGNTTVPISNAPRNIGVLFEDALTMFSIRIVWHISTFIVSAKSDTFLTEKLRK